MVQVVYAVFLLALGFAVALGAPRLARSPRGHVWRTRGVRPLNALGRGLMIVHFELGACTLLALGLPHWLLPPVVEAVAVLVVYLSFMLNAALVFLVTAPAVGLGIATVNPVTRADSKQLDGDAA
jgi:hypothetical protein